jgi:CDP-diacylglycerol--serine O-phosphatidyltransferase
MNTILSFQDLQYVFLLSVPLTVAGIIHMIAVKLDILSYLKKPIHQSWFGLNKTWRGFFVMPLATLPGVYLALFLENMLDFQDQLFRSAPVLLVALVLGLAYCLAELPNSFIKRKLGIKEGQTSDHYKWFFIILDQADSAIGCAIAYMIYLSVSLKIVIFTIIFGTLLHLLINRILYQLKLRKNPF